MLSRKRLKRGILIAAIGLVLSLGGCAKTAASTEEDLSWIDQSIREFNEAEYGEQIVENTLSYSDGSVNAQKDKSQIDRRENVIHLESRDGSEYYFQMEENVGVTLGPDGEENRYPLDQEHPVEYAMYSALMTQWELNVSADEFEYAGMAQLDGQAAIKLKRTFRVPEEETLAGMLEAEGILSEEQMNGNAKLKEAVEKNREGKKESSYWFDAESHELLQIETDTTEELIITDSINGTDDLEAADGRKVPESWITTMQYTWPKNHVPLKMPDKS